MKTEQKNRAGAKIKNNGRQYCVQYRKHVCTTFAAVVLFCTLLVQAQAAAWYFKKTDDHTPPVCDQSQEEIALYDGYYVNDAAADEKVIYLTFDAGYENGYTPAILDTLKKHNVKATFFVVGNYIETSPDLINRMVEEGHIVGNHTYHHPDMSKISDITSFQKELEDLEALYQQTTGQEMQKLYRPPQGKFSESNLKQASELGYKTVFWSLAYVDWYVDNQPTREEALEKLLPRVHPGAVILLHSTSKTNAEILDEFLTTLEEQGYTFGTLNDIV